MLLNFSSNHFSDTWSAEQLDAARAQFLEVGDMEFPRIDPTATTAEVKKIARYYATEIANTPEIKAVHLMMGEMTFLVAVVNGLKRRKMPVFCTSTKQTVLEEQDGRKTTQFEFVQFREYV